MTDFILRRMERSDWEETAALIYASLNAWYRKNRGFDLVTGPPETMLVFPRVYEALDPGCCLLAVDAASGKIAGSCFFHPRPTHYALGILNVHPDYFGKGAASQVLRGVIAESEKARLPLRLVSSAMNLESFSLYNRHGFVPTTFFQDMTVQVPAEGFPIAPPDGFLLRDAVPDDVPGMIALEKELCGIDRGKDFRFFIANAEGIWGMSVLVEQKTGRIDGFAASVLDPGSHMIGPGAARTEAGMAALIRRELSRYPGNKPVWLIPSHALELRQAMFDLGAVNCETHIGQVRGEAFPTHGIVLPSFMPETS